MGMVFAFVMFLFAVAMAIGLVFVVLEAIITLIRIIISLFTGEM